ncbi:MAG: tetratricopeptide repeat protein [Deltaproteobacteria bacterium]|nr:tetratricopeptide repeat protein [Deltaproteobacteria bacterium]
MPSEREYEQALQRDPGHNEAFLSLRRSYRESGRFDKLVTLYETRAQAIADQAKAAELFYLAAEVRIDHLSDVSGAEADLAHAVSRDATHRKAVRRLKDIYREQGRASEYVKMLEVEAAALGQAKDQARIAELRSEIERLYGQQIARIEHALSTPGLRAEVTPEQLKMVEASRRIHNALGDYPAVCRLYEIELAGTTDPKRRIALMFRLGRVLAEKIGDLPAAAQKLSDVVRLYPRDDKALEALASVFANPNWTGADGPERAAGLYNQIARRRQEAGDIDSAVASLRKALAAVPFHAEAQGLLERVLSESGRFADLDRFLRERVTQARTNKEKIELLTKRAQLAETSLGDQEEAIRTYEQVFALEEPGGPAAHHLANLYLGRHDYAKLAELREKQLERTTDVEDRLSLLRELASLYHDRLGDQEQAAVYLHAILQENPSDAAALRAYADHFRSRGSFRELADLLEFAAEHDLKQGRPVEDLLPRLEEVAVLAETKLGDLERTLAVWRRMWEVAPGYERALEAQKRILQKTKQWDQMVPLLVEEAERAELPEIKIDVLHRLARLHADKLGNVDNAIAVYLQILSLDPREPVALRNVVESYEKSERWADLAPLLQNQIESTETETEKIGLLRRVLTIQMEKLGDLPAASLAATQILKFLPGDNDALLQLEAILEKSGDKPRLVKMLEYHLRYAGSGAEKLHIIKRIAGLLQDQIGDHAKAIPYWEKIIKHVPGDEQALDALLVAYEKVGRAEDLAHVLDLKIKAKEGDPAEQVVALRRLAHLAGTELKQTSRAEDAWETLLKLQPTDREALEALSAIAADMGDFSTLAGLLQRRIAIADNPADATALALERARLFEEDLREPAEAIVALEQIVNEMDPANVAAHTALRRVAESVEDWPRVVAVAERHLALTTEPKERVARGLEIGWLYRERLSDPVKAARAFERVLEIDPEQADALGDLAAIYTEAGDGERLIAVDEKLLAQAKEPEERRHLLFDMATAAEQMLKEPRRAFEYYRRAYHEQPDETTLGKLEGTAEAYALWEDLISVYLGEGARSTEPRDQVDVALKVATLCEQRLGAPTRAFVVLREALVHEPDASTLLPELERLARVIPDWQGLLDVYAQVARGRPDVKERIALLRLRASVRENDMKDASGAFDEHMRAFVLDPDSETSHQEILRLAENTGRWEDALSVEGQLFTRAQEIEEKLEISRHAAELVETKIKDEMRAFRAYLGAFRLAPEDESIIANLWRLAEKIGTYTRTPAPLATPTPVGKEGKPRTARGEGKTTAQSSDAITPTPQEVANLLGPEPSLELDPDQITGEIDIDEVDILEDSMESEAENRMLVPGMPVSFESPWHEWVQAYETLTADAITRHRYLTKVADIWMRGAHQVDRALEALERAFALNTADESVCAEMERLAESENRWNAVCGIYQRAADRGSRTDMVAFNLRVARIRERLGQSEAAEERYRNVLVLESNNVESLDRLESIYRSGERWAELATVLERRALAGDARLEGPEMRRKAFELAELYDQRLERPYEAVDTLEKVVASIEEERSNASSTESADGLVAEARAGYAALARLLGKVGMAQKAAAALQRELELAGDDEGARAARGNLAEIYERELALPAKAIEVYEGILAKSPEDTAALAALDRLHTAAGHFEALADVLDRRIRITKGPERTDLIWRRAKVLEERLGNPDGAAACLRGLGPDALSDPETAAALLRNLRSAGLAHEAMRILEQRIVALRTADGDANLIAALYLEKAQLRADDLDDPEGALDALESALGIAPDLQPALAALARFHLKRNDFKSYAAALLRQADAMSGQPEQAAVLLEAAAVFRDQLGDTLQARACFERAVVEHPSSPETLGALASLEASEGRIDEATDLYERQLEATEAGPAKAVVLTNLARVLCENPELLNEAEARLDQALDLDPGHLPAVITMADIYYREQQWSKAERRLNEALRRLRGQPEQTARLYHRLGEVYEKLGRLEEGYRQLVEADRAMPGQLMLRIALGENRFQARRWREAAMHFESIADHEMATQYPEEVAQALTHAAQAELKLRRPERAAALHEAALRFAPSHPQTLRALADLAIERGEKLEAARSLRRVAECSADRKEQVQIFEQIGDLHLALGNKDAARTAYLDAASMLETDEPSSIPLLEKLLDLQRGDGAVGDAIATARRIAEAVVDPAERAGRRREVASLQMEIGEYVDAANMLEKVLEDNPTDETALASLCTAYAQAGRAADVADTLERLLPGLSAPADKEAERHRASLWEELGNAVAGRNLEAGIDALEKAVAMDSERLSARLRLADLYAQHPERGALAIENHRALVRLDPTCQASLRALASDYLARGESDRAWCCLQVLDVLGMADDSERAVLEQHPSPERPTDEPYAAAVGEADRQAHLAHPATRVVADVFAALWEGVPALSRATLDSLGVTAKDKVSAISDLDVAKIFSQAGKALSNQRAGLYLKPDAEFDGVRLVAAAPTAIVVGKAFAEAVSASALRFHIGRALELLRPEYVLAATLDSVALDDLFTAALKAFHPKHNRWRAGSEDSAAEEAAKLKKALPYKLAKRIAEIFQEHVDAEVDCLHWRSAVLETGNRAGLVLCGDLQSAVRVVVRETAVERPEVIGPKLLLDQVQKPGLLKELVRYFVTDQHFTLRQLVGTSVKF